MYDELSEIVDNRTTHYTIVMGDFNAKIGTRNQGEEEIMGKFGFGTRNKRGQRLIEFALGRNLYIANSKFKKSDKQKWTWRNPNGTIKNEIDFILTTYKSIIPICLKRKLYHQCIKPVITYGCQVWALNRGMENKLRTTQRSMERAIINVTKRDHITSKKIREISGMTDIISTIKKLKWSWAGHISRMKDNRWTQRLITSKYRFCN